MDEKMDELDYLILRELQKDGSMSLTITAKKLKVSKPVFTIVKRIFAAHCYNAQVPPKWDEVQLPFPARLCRSGSPPKADQGVGANKCDLPAGRQAQPG